MRNRDLVNTVTFTQGFCTEGLWYTSAPELKKTLAKHIRHFR